MEKAYMVIYYEGDEIVSWACYKNKKTAEKVADNYNNDHGKYMWADIEEVTINEG